MPSSYCKPQDCQESDKTLLCRMVCTTSGWPCFALPSDNTFLTVLAVFLCLSSSPCFLPWLHCLCPSLPSPCFAFSSERSPDNNHDQSFHAILGAMMLPLTGLPPDGVLPPLPTAATKDKRRLANSQANTAATTTSAHSTHSSSLASSSASTAKSSRCVTNSSHDASYDASHHSGRQFAQGAAYNMLGGDSEDQHHDDGHHHHR